METAPSGPSASSGRETVLVDLALQGGGSHGAFTWGVLDRLLEEPWLRIDGISGTSAGAMNAVVLVDGYEKAGPEGARAALGEFWRRSRMPPGSARSGGAPWMFFWVAGRWIVRRFSLLSTWRRVCSRLTI